MLIAGILLIGCANVGNVVPYPIAERFASDERVLVNPKNSSELGDSETNYVIKDDSPNENTAVLTPSSNLLSEGVDKLNQLCDVPEEGEPDPAPHTFSFPLRNPFVGVC